MNLLKNFGGAMPTSGGLGASKPLGAKSNYFSTLKLQYILNNTDKIHLQAKENRKMLIEVREEKVLQKISSLINLL